MTKSALLVVAICAVRFAIWSTKVRVRFRVRFQDVKVPIFRGLSPGNATEKARA